MRPARLGVAPSRFAAVAAASKARPRRAEVTPAKRPSAPPARPSGGGHGRPSGGGRRRDPCGSLAAYLAPLPIALLGSRPETAALPEPLERFGIRTLGELAALPRAALADRFGAAGPLARDLARGRDTPLVPRRAAERLEEALELPESGSGTQLEHALGLLIDRLVARRERRGRTFRAVVLSASLVEGGTWRLRMTFRDAHADPRRMRLALAPRLAELPAPADVLRLRVEGLGPPAGLQRSLISEPAAIRAARLREAVRQTRAVAGPDAALRIVPVDPDSRVPERGTRWPRGIRDGARGGSPLGAAAAPKSRGPRRLATPRKVAVEVGEGGRPETVGGRGSRSRPRVVARRGPLVVATARCAAATGRS